MMRACAWRKAGSAGRIGGAASRRAKPCAAKYAISWLSAASAAPGSLRLVYSALNCAQARGSSPCGAANGCSPGAAGRVILLAAGPSSRPRQTASDTTTRPAPDCRRAPRRGRSTPSCPAQCGAGGRGSDSGRGRCRSRQRKLVMAVGLIAGGRAVGAAHVHHGSAALRCRLK